MATLPRTALPIHLFFPRRFELRPRGGPLISGARKIGAINLIQITAPISHGSSGGPIMNTAGHVIGVSTLMLKEGQSLNFAVPAPPLLDLINTFLTEKSGHS